MPELTTSISTNKNISQQQPKLEKLVHDILNEAKNLGATAAEVDASVNTGFSVDVRMGEVETVEYNHDKAMGITVYMGQRTGSASTTDTSWDSVKATVKAACEIAKVTGEDEFAGLAEAKLMAKEITDLDLYHPWMLTPEQAIDKAKECEEYARNFDKRITNSEGASVSNYQGIHIYGNSHGMVGGYPKSRHSISCALVGKQDHKMQRDFYFTAARDANDLESIKKVGQEAAERTVKRLGARQIKTCKAPVIFEASVASSLLAGFVAAVSGGNLYRKTSFLLDKLGQQIFSDHVKIFEQPYLKKGLGSAPFDADGVATREHEFVKDGVLQSYILGSYSARKLGMETTANAGGVHNLSISTSDKSFDELVKEMGRGLIVTDMMGRGINIVTGDYSRGASGFWVENGEIQFPVDEVTIAGNLSDMFLNLLMVANDVDRRRNICSGSILIDQMTIAGE